MRDEEIAGNMLMELLKIAQSGQLKQSIEDLNRTVANLKYNLDGMSQSVAQLNKEITSSNKYLEEIAELNRSASKQTKAVYILTVVMVVFMVVQTLIMKNII
jgi:prefoldin subunit 5